MSEREDSVASRAGILSVRRSASTHRMTQRPATTEEWPRGKARDVAPAKAKQHARYERGQGLAPRAVRSAARFTKRAGAQPATGRNVRERMSPHGFHTEAGGRNGHEEDSASKGLCPDKTLYNPETPTTPLRCSDSREKENGESSEPELNAMPDAQHGTVEAGKNQKPHLLWPSAETAEGSTAYLGGGIHHISSVRKSKSGGLGRHYFFPPPKKPNFAIFFQKRKQQGRGAKGPDRMAARKTGSLIIFRVAVAQFGPITATDDPNRFSRTSSSASREVCGTKKQDRPCNGRQASPWDPEIRNGCPRAPTQEIEEQATTPAPSWRYGSGKRNGDDAGFLSTTPSPSFSSDRPSRRSLLRVRTEGRILEIGRSDSLVVLCSGRRRRTGVPC